METHLLMDRQKGRQGTLKAVTAVVPAYNEAPRLGAVLDILSTYPGFKEIIVVDDGSTDGTAATAEKWGVRVIRNEENMGKGYSMDRGIALAESDIIFFSDADIAGLTHEVIDEILSPVLQGTADMFIGMSDREWYVIHEVLTFVPLLGGERAITKSLWHQVPQYYKEHFRIEAALNFYSIYYGKGYTYKILNGVTQTKKEEKYGFFEGAKRRVRMYYNVFSAQLRLNLLHAPKKVRRGRWLALLALAGVLGTLCGILIFTAIYFGPSEFVRYIFAKDLRDPEASIAPVLLYFARFTAISTIALVGLIIFITGISIFLLTWKNLSYLFYAFLHKLKNGKRT